MKIIHNVLANERGVFDCTKEKNKIILINTNATIQDHFVKITTRLNNKYDKAPAFTISLNGDVYQHFDSKKCTNLLGRDELDETSIVISLENLGYLYKNESDNTYYDWKGNQYNGRVATKAWRQKKYWAKYSTKQINALVELIDYLCKTYGVPKNFVGNNVLLHKPDKLSGIFNRSNFFDFRHDLSPAMNFEQLANLINNKNEEKK